MRPVLTIILVVLALVAVVVLLLVSNAPSVDQNNVTNPMDTNLNDHTNDTPSVDVNLDVNSPVVEDLTVDCGTDFSCFLNNILTCESDVVYTQTDTLSYPDNGTENTFSIKYNSLGFNEFNECEVMLTLEAQRYSFNETKKQEYLNNYYTEAGVLEVEDSLNVYNEHLISKTGVCKLDASAYTVSTTSLEFLDSIMQNIQNCSGDLFTISEDRTEAPFFIYIN